MLVELSAATKQQPAVKAEGALHSHDQGIGITPEQSRAIDEEKRRANNRLGCQVILVLLSIIGGGIVLLIWAFSK